MKKSNLISGLVITLVIVAAVIYWLKNPGEEKYQIWADCERVKHIKTISSLIEEFKNKNNYYPLGKSYLTDPGEGYAHVPANVNITQRELPEEYKYPPPGVSGRTYSTKEFELELSDGLGRVIKLPSDPQKIAVWAPNFYQYVIYPDGNYFLSANFYNAKEYTRNLDNHYNKFTVGSINSDNIEAKIFTYDFANLKMDDCR